MAHKRQGQLTTSGEWARHLRPFWRRIFWKQERQAAQTLMQREIEPPHSLRPSNGTVEELLAKVSAVEPDISRFELWVPAQLTLSGVPVAPDVAMTVVLDRLLQLNMFPVGFEGEVGGKLYRYSRE